ncbi:MAG: Rha family transcriptional regulator [Bacilli bacterium]
MVSAKYWLESSYKDSSGKTNRNFQISKRGCEFLAHKTTGTKGNLFTDKYMDKFEVMENYISNEKISSDIEERLFSTIDEIVSQKIEQIENKCAEYYRPSSFEKYNISTYIKKRLGIKKANDEYELVKQRVLIKLGATKWEDVDIETLKTSLNIIDESIRVIKADRPYEQRTFFE